MIIHRHTRTRCAAEAIAMETGPTLTGERALGVVADGITMATGRLALVNICVTERDDDIMLHCRAVRSSVWRNAHLLCVNEARLPSHTHTHTSLSDYQ